MDEFLKFEHVNTFSLADSANDEIIRKMSYALSVPERIQIVRYILNSAKKISDIAEALNIPISSVSRHVNILHEAGLIHITYQPGIKGHEKYCSQAVMGYNISFNAEDRDETPPVLTVELPIGLFSHCHIKTPCGMVGKDAPLVNFDSPNDFFLPERVNAECLWFDRGFISYNFPTPRIDFVPHEISFSFEICSETQYYNNNWPSDITIYINKMEMTTFTSPGDFGGRRGKYTPEYWPITSTQFGLLRTVSVNDDGVFFDNQLVNKYVKLRNLNLLNGSAIQLTIGIKDDAVHKGGINLFGKNFGDHPQAIVMTLR